MSGSSRSSNAWLLGLPAALAGATLLYRWLRGNNTNILAASHANNEKLVAACPSFKRYRAPAFLLGGHMSTIYSAFMRRPPNLHFYRVLLTVPEDGGAIALDWHTMPFPRQPVLIIQHGLTGGSQEAYVQWMIKTAHERLGFCCVVMNSRGCSDTCLTTARSFSGAWTKDIAATIRYIRGIIGPDTPIFGVGYSLGGGLITKYVAESGSDSGLTAAVACCSSFDMHLTSAKLQIGLSNLLYNRRFARNLKRFIKKHEHHFIDFEGINLSAAYSAQTIREFDAAVMVPMFGYKSVDEYYTDCSTDRRLKDIRIPFLVLNAVDDPICRVEGFPQHVPMENSNIIAVLTDEGGHVAWPQGVIPRASWDNDVICEYFAAVLDLCGYKWESEDVKSLVTAKPFTIVPTASV